jgi:hypothetical protein
MPLIALDNLSTGRLIGAYDLPQFFRVESFGEGSRADEITEHHGEVASFSFGTASTT